MFYKLPMVLFIFNALSSAFVFSIPEVRLSSRIKVAISLYIGCYFPLEPHRRYGGLCSNREESETGSCWLPPREEENWRSLEEMDDGRQAVSESQEKMQES